MTHHVYMLENSLGRRYVGRTQNLEQRLRWHRNGKVQSTRTLGDWENLKVVHLWECGTFIEASKLERLLHSIPEFLWDACREDGLQQPLRARANQLPTTRFEARVAEASHNVAA